MTRHENRPIIAQTESPSQQEDGIWACKTLMLVRVIGKRKRYSGYRLHAKSFIRSGMSLSGAKCFSDRMYLSKRPNDRAARKRQIRTGKTPFYAPECTVYCKALRGAQTRRLNIPATTPQSQRPSRFSAATAELAFWPLNSSSSVIAM